MSDSASIAPRRCYAKPFIFLTILIAAAVHLVGNDRVTLWDRDEPRYAQCTRQMLFGFPGGHGPDLIVPRFLNQLRTEKPPLIYWLQAGAMKLFGDNSFAVRFPSSLAIVLVLILMAFVFYRIAGPPRVTWAVLIMASSALTIMSAKMCLTDATLLLWDTIALLCTYAVYRGNRSWWVTIALWVALGLGGMTKGPIVLAVLGATLVALAILERIAEGKWNVRWWLELRPWVGVLILAAIDVPWLWAVHQREPDFLPQLFNAAKRHLASESEKHAASPGYYLAAIWGLLFPWSLLLPLALAVAWRQRKSPLSRFALAVTLGVWIFQECMKAKLPFYVLPTFPFLAYLTADAIVRCLHGEYDDFARPGFVVAAAIWAVAVLALGGVPWLLEMRNLNLGGLLPTRGMIALSTAAALYAAIVFDLLRSKRAAGFMAMGLGSFVLFALIFTLFLPKARFLQTSERLAAIIKADGAKPNDEVKMIEYKEPSLAYYRDGSIVEERLVRYFDETPRSQWPKYAVLPKTVFDRITPAVAKVLEQVGPTVRGLDYAGKIDDRRVIDVLVVKPKP